MATRPRLEHGLAMARDKARMAARPRLEHGLAMARDKARMAARPRLEHGLAMLGISKDGHKAKARAWTSHG